MEQFTLPAVDFDVSSFLDDPEFSDVFFGGGSSDNFLASSKDCGTSSSGGSFGGISERTESESVTSDVVDVGDFLDEPGPSSREKRGGVCLHVNGETVSLEFCSACNTKASR